MKITLYCPSRGRPKEARELWESFEATRASDDAALVFLLDRDDPTAERYTGTVIVGEPTGDPTGPLNRAALASASAIVGFIGDDSRFETPGWDLRVLRALEEPGFCWPRDGTAEHPWPSTAFVSREIVQALGWLALPELHRGFFDVVWFRLAENTGSGHALTDVMVRHDNSAGDPASPNFKPDRQVPPEIIQADERAFWSWRNGARFFEDCAKVRSVVQMARLFPTTV